MYHPRVDGMWPPCPDSQEHPERDNRRPKGDVDREGAGETERDLEADETEECKTRNDRPDWTATRPPNRDGSERRSQSRKPRNCSVLPMGMQGTKDTGKKLPREHRLIKEEDGDYASHDPKRKIDYPLGTVHVCWRHSRVASVVR